MNVLHEASEHGGQGVRLLPHLALPNHQHAPAVSDQRLDVNAIGQKAADTVNSGFEAAVGKGLPVTQSFPPVASPSVSATIAGEAAGNSAGAVAATSTCAVVNDPC